MEGKREGNSTFLERNSAGKKGQKSEILFWRTGSAVVNIFMSL